MKEEIDFSAFSPTDYRYAVDELRDYLSEEAFVNYKAKRSEEHTSELQSLAYLVCRLLLEHKKKHITICINTIIRLSTHTLNSSCYRPHPTRVGTIIQHTSLTDM